MTPRFSVVIPTLNGAETLPPLLDVLWAQRTTGSVEIIAIDSGSNDGTVELLQSRVQQLIKIPAHDFNHGLTRNLGMERARGEYVVLLVQDALPVGDSFLETLAAPLAGNSHLAGTFARQRPRSNASAITRHYLNNWVASHTTPRTARLSDGAEELEALTPGERLLLCAFDNVASCIRRSVWEKHPFKATPIAEDLAWSREVLLAGHSLAFVPEAVVIHSHDRGAVYEYRRTRVLHEQLGLLFGLRTIPTIGPLARSILSTTFTHVRVAAAAPAQWPRALALAVAWPLGQYVGGRAFGRGGGSTRLPPGTV